ncbi:MAG: response regulator transcription factor [Sporichthyaceae bacterium]|nr:response regulator transcription factor [Sporichthyaceae bacterium]
MERIPVAVHAEDPLSLAGVVSQLRPRAELTIVELGGSEQPRVAVVVADVVDEPTLHRLRVLQRAGCRSVLVVTRVDDSGLAAAVEAGISGLIRRSGATADRLAAALCAADRGEATVPPDLLGRLLDQVGRIQRQVLVPRGLAFNGMASREVDVLRLVAEGYDTAEIAEKLAYSERTVKNVLHDVTTRLQLRNRSHAVAYAVREGLI